MNINEQPLSVKAIEKEKEMLGEKYRKNLFNMYLFFVLAIFFILSLTGTIFSIDRNELINTVFSFWCYLGVSVFLILVAVHGYAYEDIFTDKINNIEEYKRKYFKTCNLLSILTSFILIIWKINEFPVLIIFHSILFVISVALISKSAIYYINMSELAFDLENLEIADKEHCINLVEWKSHQTIADYIARVVEVGRPSITKGEYLMIEKTWNTYQESIHKEKIDKACKEVYLEPLLKS